MNQNRRQNEFEQNITTNYLVLTLHLSFRSVVPQQNVWELLRIRYRGEEERTQCPRGRARTRAQVRFLYSYICVVTPTDRPKWVRKCCLIELFCGVVCVVTLPF